ncbi:MAG: hypothetical protein H5T84_04405, partial [Thermoleophilia bacterium]|nr:hypothetical protein [Thermoleophilia bacterium]
SGVAYPDGVLEALRYYRGEPFTRIRRLGVIDPTRLEALLEVMTPLVEGQIYQADELIVTKIDEANDEELVRACEVARRLNPTAPLRLVCAVDEASLSRVAKELLARTNQTE